MKELIKQIIAFRDERNWKQFHTPANLAKSISIEAAELLECFQWDNDNYNLEDIKDELADVFIYCILQADALNLDIVEIVKAKMNKNAKKYPVDKAYNSSKKYDKL